MPHWHRTCSLCISCDSFDVELCVSFHYPNVWSKQRRSNFRTNENRHLRWSYKKNSQQHTTNTYSHAIAFRQLQHHGWQPSTNSGEIFLLTIAFLSNSLTQWNYLCAAMNQPTLSSSLSLSIRAAYVCVLCIHHKHDEQRTLCCQWNSIHLIWHLLLLLSFLYLSFSCSTKIKHTSTSIQAIFQSGKLAQHIQFNHYGDLAIRWYNARAEEWERMFASLSNGYTEKRHRITRLNIHVSHTDKSR